MDQYENELRELVDGCYAKAYRAAKAICLDAHTAEDAVAEALARVWKAAEKHGLSQHAEHYFLKIAVNEAKRLRGKRRDIPSEEIGAYLDARQAEDQEREEARALLEAVGRLPEKLGEPIRLHYYGGFSEKEVARLLGISYSAVKARMMRGRRELRKMLEQENCGGVQNEV